MRLFVLALCLGLMAACSSQPKIINPNKPGTAAQADYDECRGRAAVATALPGSTKAHNATMQQILDECMKAKGYDVTD